MGEHWKERRFGEKGFSFDKILAVSIKSLTCGLISTSEEF